MALTKPATLLFDNVTLVSREYSDASAGVDLTTAVDLAIGYRLTFNADSNVGITIFMYGDPSGSDINFTVGSYDNPVDQCPVSGSGTSKGKTVAGTYRMDHSSKYVKFRVYDHDTVSVTNFSLWIIPQQ